MKWQNRRQSSNIRSGGRGRAGMGLGLGGIIMGLVVFALTGNPFAALNAGLSGGAIQTRDIKQEELQLSEKEKVLYDYSSVVLADTEDTWHSLLAKEGTQYKEATMYIFQDNVKSGCGIAQSGMGPFYCGQDQSVYMDLSFYDTLIKEFGADEGDFILSYVISHEIGHHVQNVLGIMDRVNRLRSKASQSDFNKLTLRLELQADYLAGVVARYQADRGYLEKGDIEDAIKAAWAIGDDTIQKRMQGHVTPESFTHGTADQRMRWYKKGYDTGDLSQFNTFDTDKYPDVSDL